MIIDAVWAHQDQDRGPGPSEIALRPRIQSGPPTEPTARIGTSGSGGQSNTQSSRHQRLWVPRRATHGGRRPSALNVAMANLGMSESER